MTARWYRSLQFYRSSPDQLSFSIDTLAYVHTIMQDRLVCLPLLGPGGYPPMRDSERVPGRTDAGMVSDVATLSGLREFSEQLLERIADAVNADRATLSRVDGEWVVLEGSFDRSGALSHAG